tara:strand:- start:5721 stop:6365 length:645 start_codon:yes stop_codon:yes gene_type:complete
MISSKTKSSMFVPEVVIQRIPIYLRILQEELNFGNNVISSKNLGNRLQMSSAQIRKDLSYFGKFGKQGQGYPIAFLVEKLKVVVGLEQNWNACIIGAGRLGQSIINYPGFSPEGFKIVAAFDSNNNKSYSDGNSIPILGMEKLSKTIQDKSIRVAIVSVPAIEAQKVIDLLVIEGIKAILNYAPISPKVPNDVVVRNIDPILSLQSMTYYLKRN